MELVTSIQFRNTQKFTLLFNIIAMNQILHFSLKIRKEENQKNKYKAYNIDSKLLC